MIMQPKKPVFHWMQLHPKEETAMGPVPFAFNGAGKIGSLQSELDWKMADFCRIHQIVYKEINQIEDKLNKIQIEPPSSDIDEAENISRSRRMEFLFGKEIEHRNIMNFVDHMTVVGLW